MRGWIYYLQQTCYYVILFFILREWLIPIVDLTSTGYLSVFLLFIGLCFVLNILRLPFYVSWLCKLFVIGWFITTVYGQVSFISSEGIAFLLQDMVVNLNALVEFDFQAITNPLRTFLFFVLIWMLSYLIQYWLNVKHSIFYFLVLTVFFIATIDTFTEYDGSRGIVVTLLLGLMLTAMLYVERLSTATHAKLSLESYARYIVPMVFLISVIGVAAYFMPKAEPQWPDPIPFIKSVAGGSDDGTQSVGIDDDDTQLGGAFTGDDTVVYEVISDSAKYWRVETKATYDSKGWADVSEVFEPIDAQFLPLTLPVGDVENDEIATIESKSDNTFLIHTYGTHGIETNIDDSSLAMRYSTERIIAYIGGERVALDNYVMGISEPEYSYTLLKQPMTLDYINDISHNADYLQIPVTMPQRVRDLALEITEQHESVYDKAKAIERYFKSSGFRYETTDVAIPAEGQDYVDQFLFETKAGYCDNFSTSMVMMMRTLDIPARWVKGYAEGTDVGDTEDGQNIYEITNNDAHSWVEVFVPEIGWMPFEPTIGFSTQYDIDFDMDLEVDTPEADEAKKEQQQVQQERKEAEDIKTQVAKQNDSNPLLAIVLGVLAVLSASIMLWLTRKRWTQILPNAKPTTVKGAYRHLEKRLVKLGFIRKQGETLRAFAERVDDVLDTQEMTKIVNVYERSLYSAETSADFLEIQESYEYLINRLEG